MRTIAIINQKGGCGKTTTSINLAACLARLGQKTLLVDMDPQGHCGIGLAVPEEQIERTILDALIDVADGPTATIAEVVWQIASDFDLAPSGIKLAAFEQLFAGRPGREDRLASALSKVSATYDWCIIDCPPSVGLITFNALKACDEVVVPVETGYFSLHGLAKMMETLDLMKDQCGRDVLVRVLPTLYDTRTKLAREVLSELRAKFRDYLMESTVNFNTKLKEAASFGQPITEYDPGSRGYKDFVNLARELMGHRPAVVEQPAPEPLSRPAELVQRAKQLAQLANFQFGRTNIGQTSQPESNFRGTTLPTPNRPEPVRNAATLSRVAEFGFDQPEEISFSSYDPSAGTGTLVAEPPRAMSITLAPAPVAAPVAAPSAPAPISPAPGAPATVASRPTTAEKIDAFYGVKQIGDQVAFAARFEGANRVLIAGDFNNWSPMSTPMTVDDRTNRWVTKLPLNPGRYQYRFVVDGRWTTDPANASVETNQFGELNNVVEVR
jgi:chromosome partitioning protein